MALKDAFKRLLQQIEKDDAAYVRLAVVGQPGAGKSSLINNLLGKKVAETGQTTDVTRQATEYEFDFQRIVDLPGYGTELFRFDSWLEQFHPEQYDAFIYVFKGKLREADNELFSALADWNMERRRPLFLVRTFSADIEDDAQRGIIYQDILDKLGTDELPELYFTDCGRYKIGLDELRRAIRETDFFRLRQERVRAAFAKARQEQLAECRSKVQKTISLYAKLAAANGVNPLPGVDIAADVGIYLKMFSEVRSIYDIEEYDLENNTALPVAKTLLTLLTRQGVLLLLKSLAKRMAFRALVKYIPFVGQAAAVYSGLRMAEYAGRDYEEKCYQLAGDVMARAIEERVALPVVKEDVPWD